MNPDDPLHVQSYPESLYPSKRDAWLVVVLWLVVLISLVSAIYIVFTESSLLTMILMAALMLGTAALCYSILRWTDYTLKGDDLLVRSGPFRSTIPIGTIEQVVPSRAAWSSAALSMDRLQIIQEGGRTAAYISPEDKWGFLEDLATRSPNLRFEIDRVVKVES